MSKPRHTSGPASGDRAYEGRHSQKYLERFPEERTTPREPEPEEPEANPAVDPLAYIAGLIADVIPRGRPLFDIEVEDIKSSITDILRSCIQVDVIADWRPNFTEEFGDMGYKTIPEDAIDRVTALKDASVTLTGYWLKGREAHATNSICRGCGGTCCTGVGSDPCTCQA